MIQIEISERNKYPFHFLAVGSILRPSEVSMVMHSTLDMLKLAAES